MTPQEQHKAEDCLRDLIALGEIAADMCEGREAIGTATVPVGWVGFFGRTTKRLAAKVSGLMGDLPDLD